MTVVLFDIDGTIVTKSVRSATSKQMAYTQALADIYGLNSINYMDYPIFGLTDRGILFLILRENGLDDVDIREGETDFIGLVQKIHADLSVGRKQQYKALPGAFQLLKQLKKRGVSIGLATGNFESIAWFKLHQAKLDQFFDYGGFGEAGIDRADIVKNAISKSGEMDMKSIVLLGDTLHDVDAARQNGIHGRAVATGQFTMDELIKYTGSKKHVLEGFEDVDFAVNFLLE
ncbi:HAD hydrolase-like protein [bacterium]|nr:HAD hydrolase-like protein [bacterium]